MPLVSLAVLLLAFVLVQAFSSYSAARTAEAHEATAILVLFREAELLPDAGTRNAIRRDVVCYATSVIEQEWPAMKDERLSNAPAYWASAIRRRAVVAGRSGAGSAAARVVVERDGQRAGGRQDRLAEARRQVPDALYLLMVIAVAAAIALIGVVTFGGISSAVHAGLVVTSTFVFAGCLILIHDLDQPYGGITAHHPSQIKLVRSQMRSEVRGLPCDRRGLPRSDRAFVLRTTPLD